MNKIFKVWIRKTSNNQIYSRTSLFVSQFQDSLYFLNLRVLELGTFGHIVVTAVKEPVKNDESQEKTHAVTPSQLSVVQS